MYAAELAEARRREAEAGTEVDAGVDVLMEALASVRTQPRASNLQTGDLLWPSEVKSVVLGLHIRVVMVEAVMEMLASARMHPLVSSICRRVFLGF